MGYTECDMEQPEKQQKFIALVTQCLALINGEIDKAQNGMTAIDSLRNLSVINTRLTEMSNMLHSNNIDQDKFKKSLMTRFVNDTWPIGNHLGNLVAQIEYEFYRLK